VTNLANEHSAELDAEPGGQKTRLSLNTYRADIDSLLALQKQSLEDRRAATEQLRRGRGTLRNAARAVVKVGTLVDEDGQIPMGTMRVPGVGSDDDLLSYTKALLDRVTPHADAFVREGLPSNLLKTLADERQKFVQAKDLRDAAVQRSQAAAETIRETQDKADKTIAAIHAVAINLPNADAFVKRLRIAKRVGPRAVSAPAQPGSTTPAPAPTPPPDTATKVAS
jgi:hypothetical protein